MIRSRCHTRCAFLVASGALLTGCIPEPPLGQARDPNAQLPTTFGGEADVEPSSAPLDVRAFFGDSQLASLIDSALQNNQELNISIQEMIIANSEVIARRGEIFPSLSGGLGAGLDRVGRYTSQGRSDEFSRVDPNLQSYSVGIYASWEIDIWGRLRDSANAAVYRYLASREGRNFMVTRLVAEIATRYYELLSLDRQLEIVRNNIELQESALEMVRLQQQAARVTSLAVTRFEAQLRGFQSSQYELQQRIVETENQLNFLAGRFPQRIERSGANFLEISSPTLHPGAPARLLENRPDVRQAELELAAARLDVSAARARFYPALRLDGAVGYQSFDITKLLDTPESIFYSIFAGIAAPLLNRSGLTAGYFAANSQQMQAVLRYERAILAAYIDVNNGLNMIRNLRSSYELKAQQVEGLQQSVDISTQLFNSARADYLEVLTTRRDSLEAQMELVELKLRQLTAAVALYQALGGGWQNTQTEATEAEPAGAVP